MQPEEPKPSDENAKIPREEKLLISYFDQTTQVQNSTSSKNQPLR